MNWSKVSCAFILKWFGKNLSSIDSIVIWIPKISARQFHSSARWKEPASYNCYAWQKCIHRHFLVNSILHFAACLAVISSFILFTSKKEFRPFTLYPYVQRLNAEEHLGMTVQFWHFNMQVWSLHNSHLSPISSNHERANRKNRQIGVT